MIAHVDHVEAQFDARAFELVADREVDLGVRRQLVAVGYGAIAAQARTVKQARAQFQPGKRAVAERAEQSGRGGSGLVVIEEDIMRGDVRQIARIERELARYDVAPGGF